MTGKPKIPEGETFERELQNEIPQSGVPIELQKYEPLFHFDPAGLISDEPIPSETFKKCKMMHTRALMDKMGIPNASKD